jgi:hypothetical protein
MLEELDTTPSRGREAYGFMGEGRFGLVSFVPALPLPCDLGPGRSQAGEPYDVISVNNAEHEVRFSWTGHSLYIRQVPFWGGKLGG